MLIGGIGGGSGGSGGGRGVGEEVMGGKGLDMVGGLGVTGWMCGAGFLIGGVIGGVLCWKFSMGLWGLGNGEEKICLRESIGLS